MPGMPCIPGMPGILGVRATVVGIPTEAVGVGMPLVCSE